MWIYVDLCGCLQCMFYTDLSERARCRTLRHSNSSSPHFLHPPALEARAGCWSTSAATQKRCCCQNSKDLCKAYLWSVNSYDRFTWKKLSSLSLRIPSLSKSDTLKIRVRAFIQSGFIWKFKESVRQIQAAETQTACRLHTVYLSSYVFLLWTVQGTCGVQNCLLGVVKQLWNVLQVLCWTL